MKLALNMPTKKYRTQTSLSNDETPSQVNREQK